MKRPNILIVYTDQQRWDALGANGNKEILTPNLDRLAREGLNFDHYFVNHPLCMPSRVSFLTGRYPSALRITHMGVPVPEDTVTLPKMLRNYGYVTGNIGKLHFLPHANRDHREVHPSYGFDHLEISDEPGCYEDAYRAWVRKKAPGEEEKISLGLPPARELWHEAMGLQDCIAHMEREPKYAVPFPGRDDLTHSAFVGEQTLEFIEQHKEDTWMCIAGFYSPHSPWVAPKRFLDLYDSSSLSLPDYPEEIQATRSDTHFSDAELRSVKHGYYAMISEVDHYVGKLMDKLDALGLSDNTIVVFTSDHGEFLGDYLRYFKGYPAPDCISRVPLLIRWPEGIRGSGRTYSGLSEGVDVVPTLLESAGIPLHPQVQGRSLLPVFHDSAHPSKECVMLEHHAWRTIRSDKYRYLSEANGSESLFDLEQDPKEYRNVVAEPAYQAVLSEHRRMMLQRMLQVEAPLPRVWPY